MQSENITRTAILVLNNTNTLSLAAAVDPLRAANRQAGRMLYDWHFVTPQDLPVQVTSGLAIPANPLARVDRCDVLLVVAGFDLDAQARPALLAGVRRIACDATLACGIDGGPWILARAGLLDGHRATTHWEDLERFALEFPDVEAVNARFVECGARLASGGAAPALEMMLHLITRQHGKVLADKVARSFIYASDARPDSPQGRLAAPARRTLLIDRAHAQMAAHLEEPLPIAQLASRLGVSARRLQQHFRDHLGISPRAHYLSLRLAEADRRVTETHDPLQDIALATGFRSQASFARAFARGFGTSARARRRAKATVDQ